MVLLALQYTAERYGAVVPVGSRHGQRDVVALMQAVRLPRNIVTHMHAIGESRQLVEKAYITGLGV